MGIFGGSVAHWFALQGAERLTELLRENGFFPGRQITILNFAQGGYKQPQQLNVLNYFLTIGQRFDLVINVDGFNEIALSAFNSSYGLDISMPSGQHLLPLLQQMDGSAAKPESLRLLAELASAHVKREKYRQLAATTISAALNILYRFKVRFLTKQINNANDELNYREKKDSENVLVNLLYKNGPEIGSFNWEDSVKIWSEATRITAELLKIRQVPFLAVLQPNQHYTKHVLTNAESSYRLFESPYRKAAEKGYPAIIKEAEKQKKSGVPIEDATDLFDLSSDTVFSDSCCHFNQLGNEMLAKRIAAALVSSYQELTIKPPKD